MKTLAFYDRKDYDMSFPRIVSNSVRAIITKDNKIAMIYSEKYKIFLFPGGHIESMETEIDALIRETREETGLVVKPLSIKAFGSIIEIRKGIWADEIYEQHDYYYTCDAEEIITAQSLSESEKKAGYKFMFVSLEQAVAVNEAAIQSGLRWIEVERMC